MKTTGVKLFFPLLLKITSSSVTSPHMQLQPLAKITHARKYLKAQLAASSFDAATVMAVYERWYGANDEKLAVLMRDSPVLTRGDSGIFGSVCFMVDGVNLSTKLTAPTPEARVAMALRDIEYHTRPAHLHRTGFEMDHQNTGGFAAIKDAFVSQHGTEALCNALCRSSINEKETLPPALHDLFVGLHAQMTFNYTHCKLLTKTEHARLTAERAFTGSRAERTESPPR